MERAYRILAIDGAARTLLLIDYTTNEILSATSFPENLAPVAIASPAAILKEGPVLIAAAGGPAGGALFRFIPGRTALDMLSDFVPRPDFVALSPDGRTGYLATSSGKLFRCDLETAQTAALGNPQQEGTRCTGLAAGPGCFYTIWEYPGGGVLLRHSANGRPLAEWSVPGTPTAVSTAGPSRILVPFTAGPAAGEGLAIYDSETAGQPRAVVTVQCPLTAKAHRAYPSWAAATADASTAYLVNEDSASLTVIDLAAGTATGHIAVRRSLSALYLLPGETMAIATSNQFADLSLIDLVNGQLIGFTDEPGREFLTSLAVLA